LYVKLELRAITTSRGNRESAVMISSTMPSTKYSCSGSPLMFWNGNTAIEGLSDVGGAWSGSSVTSPTKRTPLRGKGADQPLGCAVVAERSAHRVDPRDQRRFRHDPPAPYRLQQIVLADHAVAVLHQKGQQIKCLGFEADELDAPPQFPALDVKSVVAERQNHAVLRKPPGLRP
jgi:hypothetical protein